MACTRGSLTRRAWGVLSSMLGAPLKNRDRPGRWVGGSSQARNSRVCGISHIGSLGKDVTSRVGAGDRHRLLILGRTWICPWSFRLFKLIALTAGGLFGKMLIAFSISAGSNHRGVTWGAIKVGQLFRGRRHHIRQNSVNCCLQLGISYSGQGGDNWSLLGHFRLVNKILKGGLGWWQGRKGHKRRIKHWEKGQGRMLILTS